MNFYAVSPVLNRIIPKLNNNIKIAWTMMIQAIFLIMKFSLAFHRILLYNSNSMFVKMEEIQYE